MLKHTKLQVVEFGQIQKSIHVRLVHKSISNCARIFSVDELNLKCREIVYRGSLNLQSDMCSEKLSTFSILCSCCGGGCCMWRRTVQRSNEYLQEQNVGFASSFPLIDDCKQ